MKKRFSYLPIAMFCACALGLSTQSAFAETITVTVSCQGRHVSFLPVRIEDSAGVDPINLPLETDAHGVFNIENSENYTPPFFMSFTAINGSSCGGYFVHVDGTVGHVSLPYYPTELPCSCAKLTCE